METKNLEKHIRTLAVLEESEAPIISCYIHVGSGEHHYKKYLKERLITLKKSYSSKELSVLKESLDRVQRFINKEIDETSQGVVLFHRGGKHPFELALQFEVPLPNEFAIDTKPHIYHLVELKDNYDRFIIMLSTQESGRIVEVSLGSITKELWSKIPELRNDIRQKWSKEHYQNHRKERSNRFFKEKVKILEDLVRQGGHSHIVLAGNPAITSKIQKLLPKHLQEKLVDIVSASGKEHISEVVASSLSSFIEHEEKESLAAVDLLLQEVHTAGLGAAGVNDTLEALQQGNVDMLIIENSFQPPHGYRCSGCNVLLATESPITHCKHCVGGSLQESDLKQEMVALAQRDGCHIEVVLQSDALLNLGGVGCLLRYRLN